jgi:hypothetical protein
VSVWQNLKEIAGKELRVFAADRSGALLTILLPVLLAALTGLLFGPSEDKAITLLVSHAGGPRAEKLVAALEATDGLTVEVTEAAAGQDRVARGKASALVILPPEIEQALAEQPGVDPVSGRRRHPGGTPGGRAGGATP